MKFFKNIFNNSATHKMKVTLFMTYAEKLKALEKSLETSRRRHEITREFQDANEQNAGNPEALAESRQQWIEGIKEVESSNCPDYTI